MNNFLEKENLPKLTPVKSLNRTKVTEEIEKEVEEFHYKKHQARWFHKGTVTHFQRSDNLSVNL